MLVDVDGQCRDYEQLGCVCVSLSKWSSWRSRSFCPSIVFVSLELRLVTFQLHNLEPAFSLFSKDNVPQVMEISTCPIRHQHETEESTIQAVLYSTAVSTCPATNPDGFSPRLADIRSPARLDLVECASR